MEECDLKQSKCVIMKWTVGRTVKGVNPEKSYKGCRAEMVESQSVGKVFVPARLGRTGRVGELAGWTQERVKEWWKFHREVCEE